jgi:hypothetical protein
MIKEEFIRGTEISLRACILSDTDKVFAWLYSSNIVHFWEEIRKEYQRGPPSIDDFRFDHPAYFFDGTAPDKGRSYIIINKSMGEVGHISYTSFHLLPGICELDIGFSCAGYTKKSYDPSEIRLLIKELYKTGYQKIIMRPSVKNIYAIGAYSKAGLKKIEPILSKCYKEDFINQYASGDWVKVVMCLWY